MDNYFSKHIMFTGILLSVLSGFTTADTCSDSLYGYQSCPGFFDDYDESYCCGTGTTQHCCDYNEKYSAGAAILSVAAIVGIVISVVVVIIIGICITVCVCIARRRPGTVLRTTGVANPAVITTTQVAGSPYPTTNPAIAGYSSPAAVVNPPYPMGTVNPPVAGGPAPMANYAPGQPQPNYANPAADPAKVAPPSSYAPPPRYEQTTTQTSQMMAPPTAPGPGQF